MQRAHYHHADNSSPRSSFSDSLTTSKYPSKGPTAFHPDDFTPVHVAAAQGDTKQLVSLLQADDVHVNLKAGDETTALHQACARGHLKCAEALLSHKNINVNIADRYGMTPLHWAASAGHVPIVLALLDAGAKTSSKDHAEKATPLHYAAFAGHTAVVEALIQTGGAHANSQDRWRQTPLHKAAFNDRLATAYFLIKHAGARIDARDSSDMTPLHLAASQGNLSVLRLLISKSAAINAESKEGNTPLHLASALGQYSCVLTLVSDSAIVDILNKHGQTPLELARMFGHDAVARLLVDEGADICMRYRTGKFTPAELQMEQPFMEKIMDDARVDRYGFIIKRLKPAHPVSAAKLRKDEARTSKWLAMFQVGGGWPPTKPKDVRRLRLRIRKGIPNKVRGLAWRLITRADHAKFTHPDGYYQRLLHCGSPFIKQIDLDVARTFREHLSFVERYGIGQRSLFNVLKAYSVHNPSLGYTQGMSSIVGVLLMYMHEEDAFWTLDTLMANQTVYGMNDLFVPGFPKLFLYFQILEQLVKDHLPDVCEHFARCDMRSATYSTRWFLMMFIGQVPFSLVLRIWDIFLAEGNYIFFCVALALLSIHRKELLRKNFEGMMELFYTFPDLATDEDVIIKRAIKFSKKGVDPQYIELLQRQLNPGAPITGTTPR